ncbi:MAG TPA: PIN domain-containing protein [Planctomycetaceae bacterium]
MLVLVDSNVLLRAANSEALDFLPAVSALSRLREKGHQPALVPQCCYEYYVVATRPVERNGLGLEPEQAASDIADHLKLFRLLRDERAVFDAWKALVAEYVVRGKAAHDARLVAAMRRHRVGRLLTFNVADFSRYAGEITILDPRDVAAAY